MFLVSISLKVTLTDKNYSFCEIKLNKNFWVSKYKGLLYELKVLKKQKGELKNRFSNTLTFIKFCTPYSGLKYIGSLNLQKTDISGLKFILKGMQTV